MSGGGIGVRALPPQKFGKTMEIWAKARKNQENLGIFIRK
jgi:hypothetical protein